MATLKLNSYELFTQSENNKPEFGTGVPSGTVLQVRTDLKTIGNTGDDADIQSTPITATTFATGYTTNSLSITPYFSTSKILLMFNGMIEHSNATNQGFEVYFAKDSIQLLTSGGNKNANMFVYTGGTGTQQYQPVSTSYDFIAGQTSSMILSVVITKYSGTGTVNLQHDGTHHLIVMEIAA